MRIYWIHNDRTREQLFTVNCGELRASDCGRLVRIHGMVFGAYNCCVRIGDAYGVTQLINCKPVNSETLPLDSILYIIGRVRRRPRYTFDDYLSTGEIEVKIYMIMGFYIPETRRVSMNALEATLAGNIEILEILQKREFHFGQISGAEINKTFSIAGWIVDVIDKTNCLTVRDGYGEVIVTIPKKMLKNVKHLLEGTFVQITGTVRRRNQAFIKKYSPPTDIYILTHHLEIVYISSFSQTIDTRRQIRKSEYPRCLFCHEIYCRRNFYLTNFTKPPRLEDYHLLNNSQIKMLFVKLWLNALEPGIADVELDPDSFYN